MGDPAGRGDLLAGRAAALSCYGGLSSAVWAMMAVEPQPKSLPMKGIQLAFAVAVLGIWAWVRIHAALPSETVKPAKVLLAVLAHPDDDMVCAGTLARAASSGWDVRVICATSGDAGEDMSGQKLKGAALGLEREREGAKSLAALGAAQPPIYLRFGDRTLAKVQRRLTERLTKELAGTGADVILTFGPDGFTGHTDHIAVSKATDESASRVSASSAVYHAVLGGAVGPVGQEPQPW